MSGPSIITEVDGRSLSSSPTKTPISSLQELCQRIGKTPQYDLMAMEGRAHQPQFVYRCTVGDIICNGQGGSKKAAKHAAAESVLKMLKSNEDMTEEDTPSATPQPQSLPRHDCNSDSTNPVGALQELVVARGWRLPTYALYAESGPAHKKEFVMCCAVESFKELGCGTAKKHAKRAAAAKMFDKIMALPPDTGPTVELEKGRPVSFDTLHNASGEKLQPIKLDEKNDICYSKILQRISEHMNIPIDYCDVGAMTCDDKYQCMIILGTQPDVCFHGEGGSYEEAHTCAERNAVKMLKVFFDRIQKRDINRKNTAEK